MRFLNRVGPFVRRTAPWAVLAAAAAVHLRSPSETAADAAYLLALVACGVVAWLLAWRAPPATRLVSALVAAGVSAAAAGDLVYEYLTWSGSEPDVSVADLPWLGSYAFLGAAFFVVLTGRDRHERNLDALLDALVISVVGLVALWSVAVAPAIEDGSVGVTTRIVWAAYPVCDAILLALVLRTFASRQLRRSVGSLFVAGVACWLAADLSYLLLAVSGGYTLWLDVGWMLGSALLAAAVARPPRPAGVIADVEETQVAGAGSVLIALVPLLVPGLIELVWHLRGVDGDHVPLLGASAVLLLLAYLRTLRVLRSAARARAQVAASRRYFSRLAANGSDAVMVLDPEGTITTECPQLAALVGWPGTSTVGVDASEFVHPDDTERAAGVFARALVEPGVPFATELRVEHASGSEVWLAARVVNFVADPDVGGIIATVHDITARKRVEEELAHQAFHDALTGLANRALYRDRLEHALSRRSEAGSPPPVVLFIDLDGFKGVNDTLGHDAGDDLLREVGRRLAAAVRAGDTVARFGGDEFAILLERPGDPTGEPGAVADRALELLALPFTVHGHLLAVSASIGIAVAEPGLSATDVLRDADIAMYQAKAAGKARWVAYDPMMRRATVERLQLEADLGHAVEREELVLCYQPVVELESQEIVGFEALIRWHHPTFGVVMPDRFISMAEASGDIVAIGRWVLRAACETGARWARQFPGSQPLRISVNVSGRQLARTDLVVDVAEALAISGLDPSSLVLEMTESALVEDPPGAARQLHALRSLGILLAIDDFGTGYSSLSYLRQFPVDILKIDRSFINTITDRNQVPAIVRGLLDLGRTLQLETVAEGVEDAAQRDGLRDERCRFAQGFLFARPLDAVDAELLLAHLALERRRPAPA